MCGRTSAQYSFTELVLFKYVNVRRMMPVILEEEEEYSLLATQKALD